MRDVDAEGAAAAAEGGEGDGDNDGDSKDDSDVVSSDDEAPEAKPIRTDVVSSTSVAEAAAAAAAKGVIPPAAKKADPNKHCKYYSTGGTCGKKGKCRFVHDPAVREAALKERERNGGRMTLRQRLVLNDKDQEDLTIVKTLQYLKEKGMMSGVTNAPLPAASSNSAAGNSNASSAPAGAPTSPSGHNKKNNKKQQEASGVASLPTAPSLAKKHHQQQKQQKPPQEHGLPDAPSAPTVRYQGWDLSGFGNTGVKPEE